MRFLSWFSAAALLALCLTGSLAFSPSPASADDMRMTCPAFTSVKWASPATGGSGDRYVVTVMRNAMPCAQATTWVQKLIPQHVGGDAQSATDLKGGPPGYQCVGFPDGTGHAYRGHCVKPAMGAMAGFIWSVKL